MREIGWRVYLVGVAAVFLIVGCLAFPVYVLYESWRIVRKVAK